MYCLRCWKI